MCVTALMANPAFGERLRAAMTPEQRANFEDGRQALSLLMSEPLFIPGATTAEELAQRQAAMTGMRN